MTWFKVDDSLDFHPKCRKAGNKAMGLWVRSGAYSARMLTEGLIEYSLVASLGGTRADARKLVEVGLWDDDAANGGYRFHQWEQANPTRQEVLDAREAAAERKRRSRSRVTGGVTRDVTRDSHSPSQDPRVRRPDPTRPVSTSMAGESSSSHLPERVSESTKTDDTIPAGWRSFATDGDVPPGVDPAAEWDRFIERNGDGSDLRDPAAAFKGWLRTAAPNAIQSKPFRSPTPTPARPECPEHPGQPTGSVQCPECAREHTTPPRSLRALRDEAS